MAVSQFNTPNLSNDYENVINVLRDRANIAGQDTGGWGIANAVAKPIADEVQYQRKKADEVGFLKLKTSLESQLYDYQQGRQKVTQDDAYKLFDELGIDRKYAPRIKGDLMLSQDEVQKMVEKAHAEAQTATEDAAMKELVDKLKKSKNPQDQEKALALEATGKEGKKQYAKNLFDSASAKKAAQDPKSFQQYLMSKVNTGEITFEQASDLYNQTFPRTFTDPRTGERVRYTPGNQGTMPLSGRPGVAPGQTPDTTPVDNLLTVDQRKQLRDGYTEIQADPVVKNVKEKAAAIGSLELLLKKNTPQAFNILRRQIAQGIGGEGRRLTDQDVEQMTGDRSLSGRYAQYMEMAKAGKFTPENVAGYQALLTDIKETSQTLLEQTIEDRVQHYSDTLGVDPATVRRALSTKLVTGQKSDAAKPTADATSGDLPKFASLEAAQKAKLKKGEVILVYDPQKKKYRKMVND